MKKLLLFASLLLTISSFAQTIRRVNNTPGLNDPNVYATAQAAHDAAVDGDTLYFEPAGGSDGVNYGELTVTKKLTLIGPGYLLDKNPNTSFDKRPVSLGGVYFENGSTTSKIMGLRVGNITISDSLVTVTRCYIQQGVTISTSSQIRYGIYSNGRSATITNCVLREIRCYDVNANYAQNHTVSNIIFLPMWYGNTNISGLNLSVFKNNIFYKLNSAAGVIGDVRNSTIFNNIIDARDAAIGQLAIGIESTGNSVSNNICLGISALPSGSGNVNAANPTTIFKVQNPYALVPAMNADYRALIEDNFKLATNSPAKTVGVGGTEAGAFGGNTPNVLSGVPAVPVVTAFTSSGSGNSSTPLSVTISVRSAN